MRRGPRLGMLQAMITPLLAAVALTLCVPEVPAPPATLTPAESAAGWTILFDGQTTRNFRGFKSGEFPAKGWIVDNGTLMCVKGGGGGDLVTVDEYGDFELSLEYRCAPGANSGIMYRVAETLDTTWQTGPEFQVLDDAGAKVSPTHAHSAGALYDLAAPSEGKVAHAATDEATGGWNHARIRIHDGVLQHFLNGKKVVECRIDDSSWTDRIRASKFKGYSGFGVQPRGRIALQDHGDEVRYRNVKIRDLDKAMPGEMAIFNGKDLSGWTYFLNDDGKMEQVWSVQGAGEDAHIVCTGNPAGYLRTRDDFTSYVLKLEWRFSPVTKKAGNSGVLLRMQEPDKVWPKSIEAQLMSGRAGDFWNIGDFEMSTDKDRLNGRNTRHSYAAEKTVGEWNEYEIVVDGGNVVLNVNGEELNRAWDCAVIPGKIALQSEGAEIHFRRIRLAPIE